MPSYVSCRPPKFRILLIAHRFAATASQLAAAETFLRRTLERQIQEARKGAAGLGGRSIGAKLRVVCRTRGAVFRKTINLLSRSALDATVAAHIRFDALIALANLSVEGMLSAGDVERVRGASEVGEPTFFATTPAELLRVARLLIRARVLSPEEEIAISLLARDSDVRVRQLAVDACKLALARRRSSTLEAALVAALFDPDEDVISRAVAGLPTARLSRGASEAALHRMRFISTATVATCVWKLLMRRRDC